GLQDLSAWVDFSACADAAAAAGLPVAGFTTQAQFVIGALSDALLGASARNASPAALGALTTLLMLGDMGELLTELLASKRVDLLLPGRNLRGWLGPGGCGKVCAGRPLALPVVRAGLPDFANRVDAPAPQLVTERSPRVPVGDERLRIDRARGRERR